MRFTLMFPAVALLAMSAGADGKVSLLTASPEIAPLAAWAEVSGQPAVSGHEAWRYRHGATYQILRLTDPFACEAACATEAICQAWSFVETDGSAEPRCELKRAAGRQEENRLATSGVQPERRSPKVSAPPAPELADPLADLASAVRSGDAEAGFRLAKIYEAGDGTARDLEKARYWAGEAARLGHRRSMHDLAVYMIEGEGGETDMKGAAEWFTKAALEGEVDSQFNLALLLLSRADQDSEALGVALYWLLIAAGNGDTAAAEKSGEVAVLLPEDLVARVRAEASAFQARDF
ncbi:MAG: tetratricopeptide repeat protein [Hyphomonas sp.]|uniref:tetratricopeptide repeat protein n=1 Tax=Hyphomonas sp. TaxID=87 RepID=UPI0034A052F7